MKQLRSNDLNQFIEIESAYVIEEAATQEDQRTEMSDGTSVGASGRKVEICMGGKRGESGASALLEEFERKVGMGGTAVGCKCMGNEAEDMRMEISVHPPLYPPCIGVGLEDVGIIFTRLLGNGKDRNHAYLMAPS
ncbi:hypothetical protein Peur_059409 [Populus x canadensis]